MKCVYIEHLVRLPCKAGLVALMPVVVESEWILRLW